MRKSTVLIIALILWCYANNTKADGISYVSSSIPITSIEDVNRQAEAWGACSATWTLMASIAEEGSAQAELSDQMANGAKLALAMTYIMDLADDPKPGRLKSTWIYAKEAMEFMPETQLTVMMADFEQIGSDKWVQNVIATKKVCEDNLDGQQIYIDTWRNLATSGLLEYE